MRRFFIPQNAIKDNKVNISGPKAHHIRNVLRLSSGDIIQLIQPDGQSYSARIIELFNAQVQTEILAKTASVNQPSRHITIAQSLLKEKKEDRLIRQATELGISRWIAFRSERAVPKPNSSRMQKRIDRWQTIVQSAAQQCNGRVPEIHNELLEIKHVFALCTNNQAEGYFFWEKATTRLAGDIPEHTKDIILVFGPEGGFSENEAEQAKGSGMNIVSLGPRILRAETAVIVGLTLIQHFFNNL